MSTKLKLDHRPLYIRAVEVLRELLANGTYPPGSQLPPEPDLAQQLGISRSTLREAMRTFEERGRITRRRGIGTFVSQPPSLVIDSGLETLESIDSLIRRRGITIDTRDLGIESQPASQEVAHLLQVDQGSPVTVVTRTKVTTNRPVAHMIDVLPDTVVTPQAMREGFRGSVLDYLLERSDLDVSHARADIIPLCADKHLSSRLSLDPAAVLLLLEETSYSAAGQVVCYSRNYFVPEFFKFHLVRRVDTRP
jgi:GntR family transcriptional regulator